MGELGSYCGQGIAYALIAYPVAYVATRGHFPLRDGPLRTWRPVVWTAVLCPFPAQFVQGFMDSAAPDYRRWAEVLGWFMSVGIAAWLIRRESARQRPPPIVS